MSSERWILTNRRQKGCMTKPLSFAKIVRGDGEMLVLGCSWIGKEICNWQTPPSIVVRIQMNGLGWFP